MGIIEVDSTTHQVTICSHIFLYGNAINDTIRKNCEDEINEMWNAPKGLVWLNNYPYLVQFSVSVFLFPSLVANDITTNRNPRNNYIRVEEFSQIDISFVDGLGCNTGYFKQLNLEKGSTTSAHEYGHTLGLPHPENMDIRGVGKPGIMYPRGTLVDTPYQYVPTAIAGEVGGTMNPIHRTVLQQDIDDLDLAFYIQKQQNIIGGFSNIYHEAHIKPVTI